MNNITNILIGIDKNQRKKNEEIFMKIQLLVSSKSIM